MNVTRRNKNGEIVNYKYDFIGPEKVPISRYMGEKIAKRRQMQRFNQKPPKVLACEVPDDTVREMKELRDKLSYSSISRLYGLSPYLVKKVLGNC